MDKHILYRFFDGQASLEEEMEIRTWMEASEENQKAFFKERKLFDAILLAGEIGQTSGTKKTFRNTSFIKELVKIAAVIAITITGTYFYHSNSTVEKASGQNVLTNTISVPAGQRVNITLSDGTNVWINSRSTMTYPVPFDKKERRIQLDGEAFFDVAKDENHPFIVETKKYQIEALGTQFNVDAYNYTQNFETALMEGKVKVAPLTDRAKEMVLTPNKMIVEKEGKLVLNTITDYNHFRWKEGLICFKNQTFAHIMDEFEKCFGMKINVQNKQVMKYVYTGKFRQSDGVDYALRVLQKDIYFKFDRDDENHIIFIK